MSNNLKKRGGVDTQREERNVIKQHTISDWNVFQHFLMRHQQDFKHVKRIPNK